MAEHSFFLRSGKGIYGNGHTQISKEDIVINYQEQDQTLIENIELESNLQLRKLINLQQTVFYNRVVIASNLLEDFTNSRSYVNFPIYYNQVKGIGRLIVDTSRIAIDFRNTTVFMKDNAEGTNLTTSNRRFKITGESKPAYGTYVWYNCDYVPSTAYAYDSLGSYMPNNSTWYLAYQREKINEAGTIQTEEQVPLINDYRPEFFKTNAVETLITKEVRANFSGGQVEFNAGDEINDIIKLINRPEDEIITAKFVNPNNNAVGYIDINLNDYNDSLDSPVDKGQDFFRMANNNGSGTSSSSSSAGGNTATFKDANGNPVTNPGDFPDEFIYAMYVVSNVREQITTQEEYNKANKELWEGYEKNKVEVTEELGVANTDAVMSKTIYNYLRSFEVDYLKGLNAPQGRTEAASIHTNVNGNFVNASGLNFTKDIVIGTINNTRYIYIKLDSFEDNIYGLKSQFNDPGQTIFLSLFYNQLFKNFDAFAVSKTAMDKWYNLFAGYVSTNPVIDSIVLNSVPTTYTCFEVTNTQNIYSGSTTTVGNNTSLAVIENVSPKQTLSSSTIKKVVFDSADLTLTATGNTVLIHNLKINHYLNVFISEPQAFPYFPNEKSVKTAYDVVHNDNEGTLEYKENEILLSGWNNVSPGYKITIEYI